MSQQLINGKQQFIDGNGNPLAGGSVAFYQPGTLTPVNTYQDPGLTTPNTNPVVLDANGMATIWGALGTQYRQVVTNALGVQLWDQVVGTTGTAATQSVQAGSYNSAPDTGTANAYAIALSPAPTALTPGMTITVLNIKNSNTGASTLNANGLGAIPIYLQGGFPVPPNAILAGASIQCVLNGLGNAWTLVNSSLGQRGLGVNGYPASAYASNVTYTNTQPWPIFVSAFIQSSAVGNAQLLVNGSIVAYFDTGNGYGPINYPGSSISCIVPAGATWRFNVSATASGAGLKIFATL